jgi:glycosyltransferase involved in cell wall biosynthesis
MNVLVLYQYFGTNKGGWSTRIYEFTKCWSDSGATVTVITAPFEKSDIKATKLIERQKVENINLIVINVSDSNRNGILKRVFNFILFSVLASWYTLTLKYDVVVASSGPIFIGIPGLIAKVIKRKKFIFEIRDLWPGGAITMGLVKNKTVIYLAILLEKTLYFCSDKVVAASVGMKQNIQKRYPTVPVEVITNISDNELFDNKNSNVSMPDWAKNKQLILHIGSLGFIHNCIQIVEAIYYMRQHKDYLNDFVVVFIGEGAERKMLEDKVVEYSLEEYVKFLGLIPKLEVAHWMKKASMSILTTLDNEVQDTCSPNKVFDTFAAGVPLVQTTKGWLKELLDKEKCGLNVQSGDPESMARAIEQILLDQQLQNTLGTNAKRVAINLFDKKVLGDKYYNILNSVVNPKRVKA